MDTEKQISGLIKAFQEIQNLLHKAASEPTLQEEFQTVLTRAQQENPWFTQENLKFALEQWAQLLTRENIKAWLSNYRIAKIPKKVGLILAGNIPIVGFHDVLSVILSGNIPMIKMSSKDRLLLPFILKQWSLYSEGNIKYELVEKLQDYDAVIATGSNNTARYLEYYFKDTQHIIRKNRTSVAVLTGDETDEELKSLGEDVFRYFGMGCRNVTQLLIPEDFPLDRIFENFTAFGDVINHNSYANNYDYHKAIYLLNQEKFWDNNVVMMKEETQLFSPLSVLFFSRYNNQQEVHDFLEQNTENIQCVVAKPELGMESVYFGETQKPSITDYADNIDTMRFLELI